MKVFERRVLISGLTLLLSSGGESGFDINTARSERRRVIPKSEATLSRCPQIYERSEIRQQRNDMPSSLAKRASSQRVITSIPGTI